MIYYIGYYSTEDNDENRHVFLSATNKMKYIMDTIVRNQKSIKIVSLAGTNNTCSYPQRTIKINDKLSLHEFSTLGKKFRLMRMIDRCFIRIQFLLYLFKNVKKNDIIIMYHATQNEEILIFAKRIIKFKLILEVEELYGDVCHSQSLRARELKTCKKADGFILPTSLLGVVVNKWNKPFVVIHGTYEVENNILRMDFDNNSLKKKHIVYAGTFDSRKGGAIAAAAAAYLSPDYHIHILGFGTEEEKLKLQEVINHINSIKNVAIVTMDGLLKGKEFISFLQSCDIGLSTQNPIASFNDTSFPSKILTYLANGLRVVSVRIPVVNSSKISNYVYYYDEPSPICVAEAIKSVDLNDSFQGKEIIKKLDTEFRIELISLFEKVNNVQD